MAISQEQQVEFWNKQLNKLIDNRHKAYARDTLKGIKKTINDTGKVTDDQVRAIKNIQNGKDIRFQ